jgi:hypothetical protein
MKLRTENHRPDPVAAESRPETRTQPSSGLRMVNWNRAVRENGKSNQQAKFGAGFHETKADMKIRGRWPKMDRAQRGSRSRLEWSARRRN